MYGVTIVFWYNAQNIRICALTQRLCIITALQEHVALAELDVEGLKLLCPRSREEGEGPRAEDVDDDEPVTAVEVQELEGFLLVSPQVSSRPHLVQFCLENRHFRAIVAHFLFDHESNSLSVTRKKR